MLHNVTDQQAPRLYAFGCGTLSSRLHWIKLNQIQDAPFVIPVPWYVVSHPAGYTIIDGGNAAAAAVNHVSHWGPEATGPEGFTVHMRPEDACVPQLRAHGFSPEAFRFIVQTHLHPDHDGAIAAYGDFGQARVVVSREEWQYSKAPEWPHRFDYVRADLDRDDLNVVLLDSGEDGYDLYGDRTVLLWHTPGHTVGHMSVEVRLPSAGSILLTGDASYTRDHWEERALPGSLASVIDSARSVRKLRRIADRENSKVIFGHDPDQWEQIQKAPAYFD